MTNAPCFCRMGGRRAVVGLLLVLCAAPVATAYAQDVSVRAYLTPGSTVGVGQPFVLAVEITGTQSIDEEPEIPDLSAFAQYLGSNTQSSMQMVNGRTSVSLTVHYRFQALTEGTFEIPAFDVSAGGGTHRTAELQLRVAAEAPTQAGPSGTPVVAPDDLFITADATKSRVREGEPFVVEYRIWTRVDVSSFNFTRVPEPQGFWVEDITPTGQPQVEQLVRDGQQYASAVIRRVALVPTGSGLKTIDPVVLEAQVRVRGNDPFDRFFGSRSLFGTRTVPTGIVSDSLTIVVEPLPPGAPQPFSGIVGDLDIDASLDRDSVGANEAVTLTVRVSGDGNIRAVPPPELSVPEDFEVFPPEISESLRPLGDGLSGEKTFEYVLIPRAPGRREIPSIAMSYFDRATEAYRLVESGALPLTVSGAVVEGPAGLVRGGVAELRRDIRYIHLGTALRPAGRPIFEGAAFWLFLFLPLVGIAGALTLRRHRDLLEGDIAYARGRAASRVAKKRLAEAKKLAGDGDARTFYAEVAKALRGLVADRLNLAEAGLQLSDLESELARTDVSAGIVEELRACLELCDRQRFAPPAADAEAESRFLERAGRLMTSLDKELGR